MRPTGPALATARAFARTTRHSVSSFQHRAHPRLGQSERVSVVRCAVGARGLGVWRGAAAPSRDGASRNTRPVVGLALRVATLRHFASPPPAPGPRVARAFGGSSALNVRLREQPASPCSACVPAAAATFSFPCCTADQPARQCAGVRATRRDIQSRCRYQSRLPLPWRSPRCDSPLLRYDPASAGTPRSRNAERAADWCGGVVAGGGGN